MLAVLLMSHMDAKPRSVTLSMDLKQLVPGLLIGAYFKITISQQLKLWSPMLPVLKKKDSLSTPTTNIQYEIDFPESLAVNFRHIQNKPEYSIPIPREQ